MAKTFANTNLKQRVIRCNKNASCCNKMRVYMHQESKVFPSSIRSVLGYLERNLGNLA